MWGGKEGNSLEKRTMFHQRKYSIPFRNKIQKKRKKNTGKEKENEKYLTQCIRFNIQFDGKIRNGDISYVYT